jgi:hypothetical protein
MRITVRPGGARAMHHAPRRGAALMHGELDRLRMFDVDQELSLEHEKELVFVVVLVPVAVPFDDAEPDDGVVDPRQGFVEPGSCTEARAGISIGSRCPNASPSASSI